MTTPLQELIAEHRRLRKKGGMEHEMARLEEQMYRDPAAPRLAVQWMPWLAPLLDESQFALRIRRDLMLAGTIAEPLWNCLKYGMTLKSAHNVLQEAKRKGKKDPARMKAVIAEGIRAEGMSYLLSASTDSTPVPEPPTGDDVRTAATYWAQLRQSIRHFASSSLGLASIPEHERDRLVASFEADLDTVFQHHRARWSDQKRREAETRKVTRMQFRNALRALHMDSPRRGQTLDAVRAEANKQKRTLARLYHPDMNGGDESTRPQYQAVIDAYAIVERYVEENGVKYEPPTAGQPVLRVVTGDKK